MYKLKWLGLMLLCSVLMFGCVPKSTQTESGEDMSKEAQYIYILLDYSKLLSNTVGELTVDVYNKDIITQEEKEKIGSIWKEHKKYHNALQAQYKEMYIRIDKGLPIDNYDEIIGLIEKIEQQTNILSDLMVEFMGEEYVPGTIIKRISELVNLIVKE